MASHPISRDDDLEFAPPPLPPPFLSPLALQHLCQQGWVRIILPSTLLTASQTLKHHASNFLKHSSLDAKRDTFPAKQGTEFGYYHVKGEKEYLTLRCRTAQPPSSSELENAAAVFWTETMTLLMRVLMADLSPYLGLPTLIWNDVLVPNNKSVSTATVMPGSEKEICSGTLLRLFRYFAVKSPTPEHFAGDKDDDGIGGAGTHTDLGLLTLCIGQRGLECFDFSQDRYVDVLDAPTHSSSKRENQSPSNTHYEDNDIGAVLLLGQTLRGLTQHHLPAGIHRVRPPPATGRESMVFALRHGYGDMDLRPWGLGDGRVKARDLYKWLGVGKVSINAATEERDEQWARLREGG